MGICYDHMKGIVCQYYSSECGETHITEYCNKHKKLMYGMTRRDAFIPSATSKRESTCPIKEFPDEIIINV